MTRSETGDRVGTTRIRAAGDNSAPVNVADRWKRRAERAQADAYVLYYALRDPRTPWYAKAVALVVGYALSPIDPIPDVIPALGLLDELLVVPLGAALALRFVPDAVVADCRARASDAVDGGGVRWVGAALVLTAWALVGWAVLNALGGPAVPI